MTLLTKVSTRHKGQIAKAMQNNFRLFKELAFSYLWIPDSDFWFPVSDFRIPDSGFRVPGSRIRIPVPGSGFRFPDFRVPVAVEANSVTLRFS